MYKLTPDPNIVQRIADTAFIPNDPGNRDFVEYQAWLAQGNRPQDVVIWNSGTVVATELVAGHLVVSSEL